MKFVKYSVKSRSNAVADVEADALVDALAHADVEALVAVAALEGVRADDPLLEAVVVAMAEDVAGSRTALAKKCVALTCVARDKKPCAALLLKPLRTARAKEVVACAVAAVAVVVADLDPVAALAVAVAALAADRALVDVVAIVVSAPTGSQNASDKRCAERTSVARDKRLSVARSRKRRRNAVADAVEDVVDAAAEDAVAQLREADPALVAVAVAARAEAVARAVAVEVAAPAKDVADLPLTLDVVAAP